MSVVIGIIVFIIGGIVGFFANRFLSESSKEQRQLAEQASQSEETLAKYKLDVAEHLDNSAQLLEQMNYTCQTAMKQMEESTKLLQQASPVETKSMPFFSKETQEQLAETVALRHPKDERTSDIKITEPPLDYSGQASGLFEDKKQTVTNVE